MRILYYRHADNERIKNEGKHMPCDYMGDCLFHGLRSIYGSACVDSHKLDHMYDNYPTISALYGRGFTIYGKLPDISVDRTTDSFDLTIVSIHPTKHRNEDIYEVLERLDKTQIAIIDGNDESYFLPKLKDYGVLFKRELLDEDPDIHPISFAIPKNMIADKIPNKHKEISHIMPQFGGPSTYTFDNEESYYNEYRQSRFAHTCKKGGWDCLRHYEILGCGCIPIFKDLDKCPKRILTNFPKELLCKLQDISLQELLEYTRQNLTTESLARYVLSCLK